jgi:microcystin degradation protein MlrC
VVSLDLHGILTDRILQHADAVVMYHTYPHVDFYETGERAARLLLRILAGEAKPVTAVVTIPALVRGDELITATGLLGGFIRDAQAVERGPGGLSAGMFIGNPFTDVPGLCSRSVVVTDGDAARAEREALTLAEGFWRVRERLQQPLVSLQEAMRVAATAAGTVVLTDAADATSSGAPGDSNAVLRALVEAGYRKRVLAPLVDPPAVRAAFAAGVGATLTTSVGGALDPKRHAPLPIAARVRMLSDGRFRSESHGDLWNAGPTAVLETDIFTVVATSRAVSLYDRSLFLAHGQDPTHFDAVVVKSPHCQERFYKAWAAAMVNVDAPGATSANLKSLGHTRCIACFAPECFRSTDRTRKSSPRSSAREPGTHPLHAPDVPARRPSGVPPAGGSFRGREDNCEDCNARPGPTRVTVRPLDPPGCPSRLSDEVAFGSAAARVHG